MSKLSDTQIRVLSTLVEQGTVVPDEDTIRSATLAVLEREGYASQEEIEGVTVWAPLPLGVEFIQGNAAEETTEAPVVEEAPKPKKARAKKASGPTFEVHREGLLTALGMLGKIATSGDAPLFGIHGNILIEAEDQRIRITACDMEVSVRVRAQGRAEEPITICIPLKVLQPLVDLCPRESVIRFSFNARNQEVTMYYEGGQNVIKCVDPEQFPHIPDFDARNTLDVAGTRLRDCINGVIFAVNKNDNRPVMTGVNFKYSEKHGITMTAADGYRVAQSVIEGEHVFGNSDDFAITIPRRGAADLAAAIGDDDEISFALQGEKIGFFTPNYELIMSIFEGQYPDIASVIPQSYQCRIRMWVPDLLAAVSRAAIFAADSANSSQIAIVENGITVSAKSQEKGDTSSVLEAEIEGIPDGCDFNMDVRYLRQALASLQSEQVYLELSANKAPVMLSPLDEASLHIIMPMS